MHVTFIVIDVLLLLDFNLVFLSESPSEQGPSTKECTAGNRYYGIESGPVKLMDSGVGMVAALSAGLLHQISQPITAIHGFLCFMKKGNGHQLTFINLFASWTRTFIS